MLENPQRNNGSEAPESPRALPLNRNQKIAVAALAVFAVFLLVMWSVQLKNQILSPFSVSNENEVSDNTPQEDQPSVADLSGLTEAEIADLKGKDTDSDTLSDYDELYVYHSSPYLSDSDSDGVSDGEEIKRNADPNCPDEITGVKCTGTGGQVGTNASSTGSTSAGSQQTLADLLNQANTQQSTSTAGADDAQTILTGKSDAASLRKSLLNSGMDPKVLNALSDEQLMKAYQDTLNSPAQ